MISGRHLPHAGQLSNQVLDNSSSSSCTLTNHHRRTCSTLPHVCCWATAATMPPQSKEAHLQRTMAVARQSASPGCGGQPSQQQPGAESSCHTGGSTAAPPWPGPRHRWRSSEAWAAGGCAYHSASHSCEQQKCRDGGGMVPGGDRGAAIVHTEQSWVQRASEGSVRKKATASHKEDCGCRCW